MRASAFLALLVSLAIAGGLVIVAVKSPPPSSVIGGPHGEPPDIETLCGRVALGGMPRVQVRGDTTVLVMDLDGRLFSMTQANLYLTRALRASGCTRSSTTARSDGGLSFRASYPDGRPLRLELKPTGSE